MKDFMKRDMTRFSLRAGNQEGFTFIELLISMVVVVLLVMGFLGSATAMQAANFAAFERSIALQHANQVIETMRNTAASGTFPGNVTAVYPNNGSVSGFTTLTSEQVTVAYASAAANPLDVTVTVSYSENGRRAVTQTLRTYMTQRA